MDSPNIDEFVWLNDDQKALMSSALETAPAYAAIGAFDCGAAWKTKAAAMTGVEKPRDLKNSDCLRAFKVTGSTTCGIRHSPVKVRALLRLTADQAMIMKMGLNGNAWVRTDPTGENWGNMLIAQHSRENYPGWDYSSKESLSRVDGQAEALYHFIEGHDFGPTLRSVQPVHYAALPEHLLSVFIMRQWDRLHMFNELDQDKPTHEVRNWTDVYDEKHSEVLAIDTQLFSYSTRTFGEAWSKAFAKRHAANVHFLTAFNR